MDPSTPEAIHNGLRRELVPCSFRVDYSIKIEISLANCMTDVTSFILALISPSIILLYLVLTQAIMPLSNGWSLEVVFLGRNTNFTFDSLISGCAGQLSRSSRFFSFFMMLMLLNQLRNSMKISLVTHPLELLRYMTMDLNFFAYFGSLGKECGLRALPITQSFSLRPLAEHNIKHVNRSFIVCALVPCGTSPFLIKLRSGTVLKKIPVSSTFQMLLSS